MANHKLPPFPSGPRSEQIRIANLYIEAGVNVENTKRYLRHILKDQPELTPADIHFPPDLHPLVYDRLQYLTYLLNHDGIRKEVKENIQAVKELYITKKLVPEPGRVMIFRNGKSITEWFDPTHGIPKQAYDILWSKPVVPYFSEEIMGIPKQMAGKIVIYPSNPEAHHNLLLSVRLNEHFDAIDFLVLDDTGSSLLSLSYPDDILLLGYQPGEIVPVNSVEVETANGRVIRDTTLVEVNFKNTNGAYMGQWKRLYCLINPDPHQTRLSGTYIRNNLYTATAPDGSGRLFIAAKKWGVLGLLPKV